MELKVDNFTIKLHRADETSHEEEVKRFATYVSKICELGKMQETANKLPVQASMIFLKPRYSSSSSFFELFVKHSLV